MVKKNLVLSGGSIYGTCHVGALYYLDEKSLLDNIECYAGTSVGAIIACFMSIGLKPVQLWDLLTKIDTGRLKKLNFSLLPTRYGIDDGMILYRYINGVLEKATGKKNITFKELHEFTKKKLIVFGTIINEVIDECQLPSSNQAEIFDYEKTPDMNVALAVRISFSMPFFFTPIIWNGKYYVDGGIVANYPIDLFKDQIEETIGIYLDNNNIGKITSLEKYCLALYLTMNSHTVSCFQAKEYARNTIKVDCSKITYDADSSIFFKMDDNSKEQLFKLGAMAAADFFNDKDYNCSVPKTEIIQDKIIDDEIKSKSKSKSKETIKVTKI